MKTWKLYPTSDHNNRSTSRAICRKKIHTRQLHLFAGVERGKKTGKKCVDYRGNDKVSISTSLVSLGMKAGKCTNISNFSLELSIYRFPELADDT